MVVVSCAAIESARLLLNSKSKLFPQGIGNRYDWVGRNLQGHTYSGAYGLFDVELYDDVGPGAGVAICDYNHGNPGLVGGAMLCNEFIRLPYQFVGQAPSFVPRWGAVQGPTQEMPVFDSRVQVDPGVRDHWGIPVARLSGQKHLHSMEIAQYMTGKAEAWLREAGAIRTWKKMPGRGLSGGQHQAGTCRMGDDPKSSVVDRTCRVHDVDNVYVVDGSVHVTNGGFNPVLTIMAIAYHTSAHLVKAGSRSC
jgi:choline dehydrogenase-like flavoprotein